MSVITFQPVRVRTGSNDNEGRLAFVQGELVAVLVRLEDEAHGEARGRWFVEASFGALQHALPDQFGTLDEAVERLRRHLEA